MKGVPELTEVEQTTLCNFIRLLITPGCQATLLIRADYLHHGGEAQADALRMALGEITKHCATLMGDHRYVIKPLGAFEAALSLALVAPYIRGQFSDSIEIDQACLPGPELMKKCLDGFFAILCLRGTDGNIY